jgi:hypothetical protein
MLTQTEKITNLLHFIGETKTQIVLAEKIIDPLVLWTSPIGDVLIDRRSVIQEMVNTGSWR